MLPHHEQGSGLPVVLAHGFGQDRRCWGRFEADLIGLGHRVRAVDLPGHGDAGAPLPWDEAVTALGATGGRASYLGYSMGGRHALALAVRRPDLVDRLVLIGASPGLADETDRRARRRADADLADRIEREGIDAFVDAWLDQPLLAGLPADVCFEDERRQQDPHHLAQVLRLVGAGAQPPVWDELDELVCPVLLLVGERDAKFAAIAHRMAERIAGGVVQMVDGAGHAAHLERPEVVAALVAEFVAD